LIWLCTPFLMQAQRRSNSNTNGWREQSLRRWTVRVYVCVRFLTRVLNRDLNNTFPHILYFFFARI
jgi:hypothetical protein